MSVILRRRVPNDHSCLFTAIQYLAETDEKLHDGGDELRNACSQRIAADPDYFSEVVLGMPNPQYAQWIRDPLNWGGETEIMILATHFNVEIAVVHRDSGFILVYNQSADVRGRIYLLYTGQHYDPLVLADNEDADTTNETRVLPANDEARSLVLERAKIEQEKAEKAAKERIVKKLQCGGCGAVLDTIELFQAHCFEVEHDDDFAYDCNEVVVVENIDDEQPEDRLNLDDPNVFSFYNTSGHVLSTNYSLDVQTDEGVFPTAEHLVQFRKYQNTQPDVSLDILNCSTLDELNILVGTRGEAFPEGWESNREAILLEVTQLRTARHSVFREMLASTLGKKIVCVDSDRWFGVSAATGVPSGQNRYGEVLMRVRDEE